MIYARKSEEIEQSLEDHIEECLVALEELKNTRLWKLIGNEEVDLRTAVVFHDSGKIFYQKNFKRGKLSFEGHEIFSAYILSKFSWYYGKFARDISNLSIAAVLYHHHAMGVKKRINSLENLKLKFTSQREFEGILAEHKKILLKNLGFLDSKAVELALEYLNSHLKEFLKNGEVNAIKMALESQGISNRIWNDFQKDVNFKKMMIALTTALVICDYRGVKGKKTGFGKIVDEFIELYRV